MAHRTWKATKSCTLVDKGALTRWSSAPSMWPCNHVTGQRWSCDINMSWMWLLLGLAMDVNKREGPWSCWCHWGGCLFCYICSCAVEMSLYSTVISMPPQSCHSGGSASIYLMSADLINQSGSCYQRGFWEQNIRSWQVDGHCAKVRRAGTLPCHVIKRKLWMPTRRVSTPLAHHSCMIVQWIFRNNSKQNLSTLLTKASEPYSACIPGTYLVHRWVHAHNQASTACGWFDVQWKWI